MGKRKGKRSQQNALPTYGQSPPNVDAKPPPAVPKVERVACLCEATKHELINNCTSCGRVVCALEGSGPCFTCTTLVCTPREQEVLNRNSRESQKLTSKLIGEQLSFKSIRTLLCGNETKEKAEAVAHKNKLLEYNDTVARRTRVIDDEGDFYNAESNKWLSASQRELISKLRDEQHEARHGRRQPTVVTFDFAGRNTIEETVEPPDFINDILNEDTSVFNCSDGTSSDVYYRPEYCYARPQISVPRADKERSKENYKREILRIQDRDLQYMSDDGMCLTIGQPFASLIVAGIKKAEGRSWHTSYRGRLWIHSKVTAPSTMDIEEAEAAYRNLTGVTKFPSTYACGALVGCVDLVECLSQEQYREKYPEGELGSFYVFMMENPRMVKIEFPMKGKQGIYKMGYKFHEAAKKLLI